MPLYEYKCKNCGHRFERILQSFSAPDVKECPVCQGEVERLLSAPAVQFKGSGFYSTDYAPKPAASGKSHDGSSSSDGGTSDKTTPAKTEAAATPSPSTSTSKPE
jgi:putative FmdB family regulatory protein